MILDRRFFRSAKIRVVLCSICLVQFVEFAGHSYANVGPCECLMSHALLVMGPLYSVILNAETRAVAFRDPHDEPLCKFLVSYRANCCLFRGPPK